MAGKFKPGHAPYNKGRQTEYLRMVRALSSMSGYATGMGDLSIQAIIDSGEDLTAWVKKARQIARVLNQFSLELKKGRADAAERTEHESDQSQSEGSGGAPDCPASTTSSTSEPPG